MTERNARADLERISALSKRMKSEIEKRVVGQTDVVERVILALFAGGHVLLEGVPGLGKTLLVRTIAETCGLTFARVQFTPDLMPTDIVGTTLIQEDERGKKSFRFERGPIFANIVLADEVNRTTPKTQSALLEVMQEHAVTVSGTSHRVEEPFFVLATQNPLEMEGTYPLPEAQLDRFLMKVDVPFPTSEELKTILDRTTSTHDEKPAQAISRDELLAVQRTIRDIVVPPHVRDYVVRLLEATHPTSRDATANIKRYVRYGSSPRGAQSCLLASKARAAMHGRPHVSVDDVKAMLASTMQHRVLLSFEGEAEGISTRALLEELLTAIEPGKA